jgi:xylose isomerase
MFDEGEFEKVINERYSSFSEGIGKDIVEGKVDFEVLEQYALKNSVIKNKSGRQELLEARLNQYIFNEQ